MWKGRFASPFSYVKKFKEKITQKQLEITYYRKRRRLLPNDATEKVDQTDLAIYLLGSQMLAEKVYIHVDDETKGNFKHGKRRMNSLTSMAQRDDVIKRTVYVSDIDQQVTEEQLAALFVNCGRVVDCRDSKTCTNFLCFSR